MKHLNFSGSQQGALRRVLAACVLVVSAIFASAETETYVLDSASFQSAVNMKEKATSYSTDFSKDGATWHLDIGLTSSYKVVASVFGDVYYLMIKADGENFKVQSVSLGTAFFKDKKIKSVIIDGCFYNLGAKTTDVCDIVLTDDSQPIGSKSVAVQTAYPRAHQADITFDNLDKMVYGTLGISFTSTISFDFAIKSITIEYYLEVPPVVDRNENLPVGVPLWLTADKEDAAIYYTMDGTENWQVYNPERGVVFETPGTYTLKYYAAAGAVSSNVVSEEIKVGKPIGLAAARVANEEITVSGVVCGRGDGYVLIGEDAQCGLTDCVAIDAKDYSQLLGVSDGTTVKATGRPTDSFGSGVKGLGSISALEINGKPLEPAAISPTISVPAPATHYYDLTGRRVDRPTGSHIRRILISPDGEKHLSR